ncbi:hypothetical protein HY479_01115 [Candidatus Uhrbacteria bacterium]|nr:hypothetical protein [Candidatus Uhrbacteria bacterium]
MSRAKIIGGLVIAGVIGALIGAYAFSGVQRRSFLAITGCKGNCLGPNEIMGLIASVGFQKTPGLVPRAVKETDKTVVVEFQPGWFVFFPKKDIRDAAELREDDAEYLNDIYAVMGDLIREKGMTNWQIFTNGKDIQHITYLHFHLMDRSKTDVIPR